MFKHPKSWFWQTNSMRSTCLLVKIHSKICEIVQNFKGEIDKKIYLRASSSLWSVFGPSTFSSWSWVPVFLSQGKRPLLEAEWMFQLHQLYWKEQSPKDLPVKTIWDYKSSNTKGARGIHAGHEWINGVKDKVGNEIVGNWTTTKAWLE